jgi:MFS family permease
MQADPKAFRRVIAAEGVSNFGSMLSRLALPWLATLTLAAKPLQMALLLVADVAAGAVAALLAGTLVDRSSKRSIMIASDALRFVVIAGLAVLAFNDALSMWMLVVAAGLGGLLTISFELARSAWIAQNVLPMDLPARNGQLAAVGSTSETAAFAVGGWLYQALGAVFALAVDATSYLLSAACLLGLHDDRRPAANQIRRRGSAFLADLRAGVATIRVTPALRVLAALETLLALGYSVAGTSYMIFVTRDLGFDPSVLGLIFATGGLGAIGGAALAPRLARRFGRGRTMTIGLALLSLGTFCAPLAAGATLAGAALLVVQQVIGDGGQTVFQIHDRTLRQTAVAPDLLARADGGLRTLGQIATLVGALGGGWLATELGERVALFTVAGVFGFAAWLAHHRLVAP